jgi:glycosyltransferase involved in cell wall biosynthesis
MFETTSVPSAWVEVANRADQVWVPTKFNLTTFVYAGVSIRKIRVVPQAIDFDTWADRPCQAERRIGQQPFRFLSVFRWSLRKGWDVLIRAFLEEFDRNEHVELYIKTAPVHIPEIGSKLVSPNIDAEFIEAVRLSRRGFSERSQILLDKGWLKRANLVSLMKSADCFVLPTRGEGWGRPYMEAMAAGIPVIATGWGGSAEYMDDETAFLIDYKLVRVGARAHGEMSLLGADMIWAEPHVHHLRDRMRQVFEDRASAIRVGLNAQDLVRANYSLHSLGATICDRIDELRQG